MRLNQLLESIDQRQFQLEKVLLWDYTVERLRTCYVGRALRSCYLCGHERVSQTFLWNPEMRQFMLWTERCYVCRFRKDEEQDDGPERFELKLGLQQTAVLNDLLLRILKPADLETQQQAGVRREKEDQFSAEQSHICGDECRCSWI